jgi:hypothetical protein
MAKRERKPALSDPADDALDTLEQAGADEAEILRDLAKAGKEPATRRTPKPAPKAPARRKR